MFAARTDQENLAYTHQRAAASKPLNQGLAAKTPNNKAPKTPFKKQLNDENDAFNSGFKTGKKGGDTLFTKGKGAAKLDKNAFITPAGPRNRAPLGMKTTNAKGALLQTPAPAKGSAQKTVSPRLRRAKVKILQESAEAAKQEPAEPEIEYMPPRSIPLPDYPDDELHKQNWDMLRGANLTNGYYGVYMNPVGEDGLTRVEREMKELLEAAEMADQETIRKALENDPINNLDFGDLSRISEEPVTKQTVTTAKKYPTLSRAPSSLSSKRAASALSRPASSSSTSGPRFAAPTANTAARSRAHAPTSEPLSRKTVRPSTAPTTSSMRHASATAASRSTIGYSKGRAVSASTKQPLSAIYNKPSNGTATLSDKPVDTSPAFIKQRILLESLLADDPELEQLMLDANGSAKDETDAATSAIEGINFDDDDDDDELRDFQLTMPED